MKYYKTNDFAKKITSTGFITVTACVLVAIGTISWFALSRKNKNNISQTPSESNRSELSYPDNESSYNDYTVTESSSQEPVTDVNESVSDVPYTSETKEPQPPEPDFVLPIENNIAKTYSDSALQYSATYGDMRLHTGIDILCDKGSNIKAVYNGKITAITDTADYGKVITIEHTPEITVKYCGMANTNFKEGDSVLSGDVIGVSGDVPCECADNPHIHIEVLKGGKVVSPLKALGLE